MTERHGDQCALLSAYHVRSYFRLWTKVELKPRPGGPHARRFGHRGIGSIVRYNRL